MWSQSPDDTGLTDLLATAYRERGVTAQEQGDLQAARTDLEAALALRPGDEEAKSHYDAVMYILFPPKRIEINISTQRFYAWLGDELLNVRIAIAGMIIIGSVVLINFSRKPRLVKVDK